MNLSSRRLSVLFVLFALLFGSFGAMSASAATGSRSSSENSSSGSGNAYAFARCILYSDSDLAYRCATYPGIGDSASNAVDELAWPSNVPTPRFAPVTVAGTAFICSNVPNVLAMGTIDNNGNPVYRQLYSPTACSGEAAIIHDRETTLSINAQYDPTVQLTMIRFEDDLGEASFHVGTCALTPGHLAVFVTAPDGTVAIKVLNAPQVCSGYIPSPGA